MDLLLRKKCFDVVGVSRSMEKSEVFLPYKKHKSNQFHFERLDLNKDFKRLYALLDSYKPDYVINFAALVEVAPSWDYPEDYYETNAVSVVRLAHHLKSKKYLKKYVHISTPEIYGATKTAKKENLPYNPSTPYAAAKAAADMYLLTLYKHFNFPVTFIRSTNVYGPYQPLFKIIPRSIVFIKLGRKIELHGGGRAVKSYIHIRDVSEGELLAMEKGTAGSVYHLSPKSGIKISELVAAIAKKMGTDFSSVTRIVGERLGQDSAYIIDSGLARREWGWRDTVKLDAGVDEVITWVEKYWKMIKDMSLVYTHRS